MSRRPPLVVLLIGLTAVILVALVVWRRKPHPPIVPAPEPAATAVPTEIPFDARTVTGTSAGDLALSSANEHFEDHDYEAAIIAYSQVIRFAPQYSNALVARGNAHLAQGENDLAMQDYTEALKHDERNANAYFSRGVLNWLMGALDNSEADFRRAIAIDPDDYQAYQRLGDLKAERKRPADMIPLYRAAYLAKPQRAWALSGWLGWLAANKQYQEALNVCDSIDRTVTPTPVEVVLYRGLANYELENYDSAIVDLNEVIRRDPHEQGFLAYEKLYLAYRAAHQYDNCLDALTKYSTLNGRQVQAGLCSETQTP